MADLSQSLQKVLQLPPGKGPAVILLWAQAFLSAMGLSLYEITATALFLDDHGIERLPWVYIAIGVVVSAMSVMLTRLQRRVQPDVLTPGYFVFVILAFAGSRALLETDVSSNVTFVLLIGYTLYIQLHNIVLGGQAGRLMDMREMKQVFPLVMSGHVFGFMAGGFTAPALVTLVGSTSNLLFASCALSVLAYVVAQVTVARYREPLSVVPQTRREPPGRSLPRLLGDRFVRSIITYQALSAIGTQMALYLFFQQAGARYTEADNLAGFLGYYQAGMNVCSVVFLILLAGQLLRRFGLPLGIMANPAVVAVLVLSMLLAGMSVGTEGLPFFVMAVVTRVMDIVLTNGLTGTALKVTYQVLPRADRSVVATTVEGVGVPIAIAISGVILMIANVSPGVGVLETTGITLLATLLWMGAGMTIVRAYPRMLRDALSSNEIRDADLDLTDSASQAILDAALSSTDPSVVTYAIDLVERAAPDLLVERLPDLVQHPQQRVRFEAWRRVALLGSEPAVDLLRSGLATETVAEVRGVVLRRLAAIGGDDVFEEVTPFVEDADPVVRMGAIAGLIRNGGIHGVLLAGQELLRLSESGDVSDRRFAAETLGEIGIEDFYQPLRHLLGDPDPTVRVAAVTAAGRLANPRLWPLVMPAVQDHRTRAVAIAALSRGGDPVVPAITDAFESGLYDSRARTVLVQACGHLKGQAALAFLETHLDDPDEVVRQQVLRSLGQRGYHCDADQVLRVERTLRNEVREATELLAMIRDLGTRADVALLRDNAADRIRHIVERCFLLLSFRYDAATILNARDSLINPLADDRKAYALETLDVTLSKELRKVFFPLIEPLESRRQLQQLEAQFPQPKLGLQQRLEGLALNEHIADWLRACALYSLVRGATPPGLEQLQTHARGQSALLRETAIWAIATLYPDVLSTVLDGIGIDPDSRVRKLVDYYQAESERDVPVLSTIEKVLFLRSVDLFGKISDEDLVWIADTAEEVLFTAGDCYISQGDWGDCLYVTIAGETDIALEGQGVVSTLGPKNVFGEMAILSNIPRTASCVAKTDVQALKIDRDRFQELLRENPDVAMGIIHVLVTRLDLARQQAAAGE